MRYIDSKRGSTWNKWDFHVHTPYSVLNNNYGFTPDHRDCFSQEKQFDEFVQYLFNKAVENKIVAIGITDYFSIDGYKRIKEQYLSSIKKMNQLFPDEKVRDKVKAIYVFPNIELRLSTFVGKKSHAVNFHVLFSDAVSINEIEENFLRNLKINNELCLTTLNIEKIGKECIDNNTSGNNGNPYFIGLEKISVDDKNVLETLKKNVAFKGNYLISIPVDEDLSDIEWTGRDCTVRQKFYRESDFLMTSNPNTIKWALAHGREKEQCRIFGSIKPCIWGSDAHDYKSMFEPDDNRFCWIKAEPSFAGLLQVLYEPGERVCIQRDRPGKNLPHQTIDRIIFRSDDFSSTPIYFNEGLTAIIGGKSTGKSILLRHVAKSADPKQVAEKEALITPIMNYSSTSNKYETTADVYWKDGASGERKIIYIPQSWLNHLVDDLRWNSQLNLMLENIILQQDDINKACKLHKQNIAKVINSVKHDIVDYVEVISQIKSDYEKLMNEGASQQFSLEISNLENQRTSLSMRTVITPEILKEYSELGSTIISFSQKLNALKQEKSNLDLLSPPYLYINGITNFRDDVKNHDLSSFSTVREILGSAINQINSEISRIWIIAYKEAQERLNLKLASEEDKLKQLENDYSILKDRVGLNEQLQIVENTIAEEREKLLKALKVESRIQNNKNKASSLKQNILKSTELIRKQYNDFRIKISNACSNSDNLKFIAQVEEKRDELFDAINSLFIKRGLLSFQKTYNYNLHIKEEFTVDDKLFECLWKAVDDDILQFKGGNDLTSFLEKIFSDWFYIHYIVKSGEDTINDMSPGKKALVLLELIVNLEKGNCPILIDQPEDDLDNRSIYSDLVHYLKVKKHERQIIVVTHNANVVIGADAEEIIIANQAGKESPNYKNRFEYRSGSIESDYPRYDSNGQIISGVLNSKGIQQQICDILEGGKLAFELRKNKYFNSVDIL